MLTTNLQRLGLKIFFFNILENIRLVCFGGGVGKNLDLFNCSDCDLQLSRMGHGEEM